MQNCALPQRALRNVGWNVEEGEISGRRWGEDGRLWRQWKRAVRGDKARRQGQLTRLMSSLSLRFPPLSDPAPLILSPRASYSPFFLLKPPSFQPSCDHFALFVSLHLSSAAQRSSASPLSGFLYYSFSFSLFLPIALSNLIVFKFVCYAQIEFVKRWRIFCCVSYVFPFKLTKSLR